MITRAILLTPIKQCTATQAAVHNIDPAKPMHKPRVMSTVTQTIFPHHSPKMRSPKTCRTAKSIVKAWYSMWPKVDPNTEPNHFDHSLASKYSAYSFPGPALGLGPGSGSGGLPSAPSQVPDELPPWGNWNQDGVGQTPAFSSVAWTGGTSSGSVTCQSAAILAISKAPHSVTRIGVMSPAGKPLHPALQSEG